MTTVNTSPDSNYSIRCCFDGLEKTREIYDHPSRYRVQFPDFFSETQECSLVELHLVFDDSLHLGNAFENDGFKKQYEWALKKAFSLTAGSDLSANQEAFDDFFESKSQMLSLLVTNENGNVVSLHEKLHTIPSLFKVLLCNKTTGEQYERTLIDFLKDAYMLHIATSLFEKEIKDEMPPADSGDNGRTVPEGDVHIDPVQDLYGDEEEDHIPAVFQLSFKKAIIISLTVFLLLFLLTWGIVYLRVELRGVKLSLHEQKLKVSELENRNRMLTLAKLSAPPPVYVPVPVVAASAPAVAASVVTQVAAVVPTPTASKAAPEPKAVAPAASSSVLATKPSATVAAKVPDRSAASDIRPLVLEKVLDKIGVASQEVARTIVDGPSFCSYKGKKGMTNDQFCEAGSVPVITVAGKLTCKKVGSLLLDGEKVCK